ncbi:hypothetical protein [Metabacillus litoralis]|uniref:hypothetical protein n=1 Tax=Metabacillus litoralis TaxID=152268 RepID=UPI003976C73B
MEATLASIWLITIFFKIAFYFYVTVLGLSLLFKFQNYRPLIFPLGLNVLVLTLFISPNITYYNNMLSKTWWLVDFTFGLFLPFLLLVVGKYRVKKMF